ncbi:MAG: 16S rRNA (cytosine(967)-C(5))-methyltransferase RsmB [Candidatus Binatia bacterium]
MSRGQRGATSRPADRTQDPRALAWRILQRVEVGGAYADSLLGRTLNTGGLAPRDRALLTRLVYGTLAWQGYLDHILAKFCRRPPAELDAPLYTLLRLALFQICLLTRVPPFAAVNTAVELAKSVRGGAGAGLVNAVLRRAASGWRGVPFPSRQDHPIDYLSLRLSHPRWLVERWVVRYGIDETEVLLRANNESAATVVRVNPLSCTPAQLLADCAVADVGAEPCRYSPNGIRLTGSGTPEALPGYAAGQFSLQGEASQLVGLVLAPKPGERVLDLCAAPGGKATHLAELMGNQGHVTAVDTNARGVDRLRRMAHRLGLSILHPAVADAATWEPPEMPFDRILVDAPCSGLGTLRQHPEIKWRRKPEDLTSLAVLQRALLWRSAMWVRPGGIVVYATCTLSSDENEQVVRDFLGQHSTFVIDDARPCVPAAARELVGDDGVLRTFPHRHGMDGFFAVRLKARG